jgi:hypothetical protein
MTITNKRAFLTKAFLHKLDESPDINVWSYEEIFKFDCNVN